MSSSVKVAQVFFVGGFITAAGCQSNNLNLIGAGVTYLITNIVLGLLAFEKSKKAAKATANEV